MVIYYVEDDENIRELVVYSLCRSNFEAQGFADAQSFFSACDKTVPVLVLLDIMLPGQDGLFILKKMRSDKHLSCVPVIMVTAKNSEYDKIIGFDLGADDYVAKPFNMMELTARIRAVLRRTEAQEQEKESTLLYTFGGLTLDDSKHLVTLHGKLIEMTLKEFDLLAFLMKNKDLVISRTRLLEAVWGYDYFGETRTVDVHIRMIRRKLKDKATLIETVRGVGYRFTGEKNDS